MSKTFAIPLQKKGGGAFKSGLEPKSIREGYEKLGGNPFGIKPDPPLPQKWFCTLGNCPVWRDTDNSWHGTCLGHCGC